MEPQGERSRGFVGPVVWLGVDIGNPGEVTWAAALSKSCHPSVIQLFEVFGRLKEALSDGDGKVCSTFSSYPSGASVSPAEEGLSIFPWRLTICCSRH